MCERRATQKRKKTEEEICANNRNRKKSESSYVAFIQNVIPIRCNANKALTAF
jgi:hypothetical protein